MVAHSERELEMVPLTYFSMAEIPRWRSILPDQKELIGLYAYVYTSHRKQQKDMTAVYIVMISKELHVLT